MKKYVIMVAKQFPAYHPRKGEPTNFRQQILDKVKIHTIRANYPLWVKRFEKIERGEACLVLKEWEGRPYNSKPVEIMTLTKEDGIGVEKVKLRHSNGICIDDGSIVKGISADVGDWNLFIGGVAQHDGLEYRDFHNWFATYDLNEPLALIHFTKFRYNGE